MSGRIAYEPSLVSEEVDINAWYREIRRFTWARWAKRAADAR